MLQVSFLQTPNSIKKKKVSLKICYFQAFCSSTFGTLVLLLKYILNSGLWLAPEYFYNAIMILLLRNRCSLSNTVAVLPQTWRRWASGWRAGTTPRGSSSWPTCSASSPTAESTTRPRASTTSVPTYWRSSSTPRSRRRASSRSDGGPVPISKPRNTDRIDRQSALINHKLDDQQPLLLKGCRSLDIYFEEREIRKDEWEWISFFFSPSFFLSEWHFHPMGLLEIVSR